MQLMYLINHLQIYQQNSNVYKLTAYNFFSHLTQITLQIGHKTDQSDLVLDPKSQSIDRIRPQVDTIVRVGLTSRWSLEVSLLNVPNYWKTTTGCSRRTLLLSRQFVRPLVSTRLRLSIEVDLSVFGQLFG